MCIYIYMYTRMCMYIWWDKMGYIYIYLSFSTPLGEAPNKNNGYTGYLEGSTEQELLVNMQTPRPPQGIQLSIGSRQKYNSNTTHICLIWSRKTMQVTNTLPKMNIEPPAGWGLEETHFHKQKGVCSAFKYIFDICPNHSV